MQYRKPHQLSKKWVLKQSINYQRVNQSIIRPLSLMKSIDPKIKVSPKLQNLIQNDKIELSKSGKGFDIRKMIGKIPKPKAGWTPGKYKYYHYHSFYPENFLHNFSFFSATCQMARIDLFLLT